MEKLEHSLYIVELFNKLVGKPLAWVLSLFGIHIQNPEQFVPNYVVMSIIVVIALIVFFRFASRRLKPVPSKMDRRRNS